VAFLDVVRKGPPWPSSIPVAPKPGNSSTKSKVAMTHLRLRKVEVMGLENHDFYVANARTRRADLHNARRRRSSSHLTLPSRPLATVHYHP